MKKIIFSPFIIFSATIIITFTGCKKDASQPDSAAVAANSLDDIIAGSQQLILQPGPDEGQDIYASFWTGDATTADHNFNDVYELPAIAWTIDLLPVYQRSFVKFTGLSVLPDTTKIVAARLYLYGIPSSINHPQGNSIYPGSPYAIDYPDNSCYVRGVLFDWDESTLTWNNQPAVSAIDQTTIPSTTKRWNQNAVADVTGIVQTMVRRQKFYGFCIELANETYYRSQQFAVSEDSRPDKRPKLIVYYK